jgi:hypothetical protein
MKKFFITLILVILVVISFLNIVTTTSQDQLSSSFKKALMVFATAKGLNATVSVAQGTQIGPIAIGQFLDPINDIIEQFSWVMIAALTSLGIQKLLLGITVDTLFNILLALVISSFLVMLWFQDKVGKRYMDIGAKIVLLVLFIRFAVPLSSYITDAVYRYYVVKTEFNIENNSNYLDISTQKIERATSQDPNSSWLSSIKKFDFVQTMDYLKKEVGLISDYIVNLMVVYIFQTLFLPVLFLLLFYKVVRIFLYI